MQIFLNNYPTLYVVPICPYGSFLHAEIISNRLRLESSASERCITMLPSGSLNKGVSWPHSSLEKPKVWGRGSKKKVAESQDVPWLYFYYFLIHPWTSTVVLCTLHLCSFKCSHAVITCNSKALWVLMTSFPVHTMVQMAIRNQEQDIIWCVWWIGDNRRPNLVLWKCHRLLV